MGVKECTQYASEYVWRCDARVCFAELRPLGVRIANSYPSLTQSSYHCSATLDQ